MWFSSSHGDEAVSPISGELHVEQPVSVQMREFCSVKREADATEAVRTSDHVR